MKEILDAIIIIIFAIMLFYFIRGFNKQQIKKHQDLLDEKEKRRAAKDKKDD